MSVPRDMPPSELGAFEPPAGYRYEWRADSRCRVAYPEEHEHRSCRRPRCDGAPVIALLRSNGWWLYCADHTYGRRIRDGVVERRGLVPEGQA